MYPSLTSIGSGSHWYSKKQTPQENLMEITYMEQELARRREMATEVDVPIKIRGKVTVSNRTNLEKEDTHMDEEEEEGELDGDEMMLRQQNIEELEEDLNQDPNYNNEDLYNMYDPEEDQEEDRDDFQAMRGQPLPTAVIEGYNDYENPMDS